MAEFVQTMKDWKRMCISFQPNCEKCKLFEMGCDTANMMDEPDRAEKIITKWAAEHPEPVYPTWKKYFASLYGQNYGLYGDKQLSVSKLCDEQIPPEVAQKLGLEPKYG